MLLAAQHELLLQIIERPDDDLLRLVLADRLNEAGDPLGELIQVQCALERLTKGEGVGDYAALKRRELELVRGHGGVWHQSAAPFARRLLLKRGLPHTLCCSANALLDDGGLTVLAPIEHLELEHVSAAQLPQLLALPLLRRIRALAFVELRGPWPPASVKPEPVGARLKQLRVPVDTLVPLDRLLELGLLDAVEELELGARFLAPQPLDPLAPPRAPRLRRLAFVKLLHRDAQRADEAWLPHLQALAAARPGLVIGWRGLDYEAWNLGTLVEPPEPEPAADEPPPPRVPAAEHNREPFGEVPEGGTPVVRSAPSRVRVVRLPDGALLASAALEPLVPESAQSLSLDAATQLRLEAHPGVLTALSFTQQGDRLYLRYERWPSTSLRQLGLPLPLGPAAEMVRQLAHALPALREGLRAAGQAGWPRALGIDDVLVGADGQVKLWPPLTHCLVDDLSDKRRGDDSDLLGRPLDDDLEGTTAGMLQLLGAALMHLLAGTPVSRRLRPSALDPSFKPLDAVVEGCLARVRSLHHPSLQAFAQAVNRACPQASKDALARFVSAKQIAPP